MKKVQKRTSEDKAIYESHLHYGYKMREISDHLGLHYASIIQAIKRVEEK